jgi:hypothetical protein
MIGPFKPTPGNFKCVFMMIDKFSKWIEYMPLTKASSEKAVEFLDQIIHRDERSIVVKYVSVVRPRANG